MKTTFQHNPQSQTIIVKKGEQRQFVFVVDQGVPFTEGIKPDPIKLAFDLKGEDSNLDVIGLILGHGSTVMPFDVSLNHLSPRTTGRVSLKSVLKDSAQQFLNAMINIPAGAVGADSYLSHRTLVLSPLARTKTIPSLEILEDDVKASHGATVGKIDTESLFYLRSRGLTEGQARKLVINGFLDDLVSKIEDTKIESQVRELLAEADFAKSVVI